MATMADSLSKHPGDLGRLFPSRNEDVHGTNMDGESVLLNLTTGRYYTLNAVGALIWEQCSGDHSLKDMLSQICAMFDVPEDQAKEDLLELIAHLGQEGLVETERR